MPETIAILTPLYNDWDSLAVLLPQIDALVPQLEAPVQVYVVNDGSTQAAKPLPALHHIDCVQIIHLVSNQGHQRAIAVGLSEIIRRDHIKDVIIIDSDGEDRPEDILGLLQTSRQNPNHIIVARRRRRSEGPLFALFYALYKSAFHFLIGARIDFGNYCLIPIDLAEKLAYNASLWNHLAATIVRSRIPIIRLDTNRGKRYAGKSKMNWESLVVHGLSAISVYSDIVFTRALLFSFLMAMLAGLGILTVVGIKILTDLAIPGWATTAVGLLAILLTQSLTLSAGAAFVMLHMRSQVWMVPAIDTLKFIKSVETLHSL